MHAEIVLADAGGLALLAQIYAATDRAQALAEAIERDGATLRRRSGNVRVHPVIGAELSLRAFISRGLGRLGLLDDPVKSIGRPPGS